MKHKLQTLWNMIRTYKNWVRLILYRLNYAPQPMVVKVRDGSRFYVRGRNEQSADAYVINESYLYGIHDEMLPYLKTAQVGLDIGAHIGTFAVFAAKHSSATIYAIEPDPANREVLIKNLELNGLRGRVIPTEALITGASGEREIYFFRNRGVNSIYKEHGSTFGEPMVGSEKIKSYSLGDFLDAHHIEFCDFIKMDVEGAEHEIFKNTPQVVFDRIGVMGLEIGNDKEELVAYLEGKGFKVSRPRAEFSEYFCVNKKLLR